MKRITLRNALDAIIAFCDHAPDLVPDHGGFGSGDPSSRKSLARLIEIANETRPKGKICNHQNEDYPEMRCTRRTNHKGRHARPASGASW